MTSRPGCSPATRWSSSATPKQRSLSTRPLYRWPSRPRTTGQPVSCPERSSGSPILAARIRRCSAASRAPSRADRSGKASADRTTAATISAFVRSAASESVRSPFRSGDVSGSRSEDLRQVGEILGHLVGVERVVPACLEFVEGPDPAAVLWRPLPPPADAARVGNPWLGRDDLLYHDVVPPVVTEVVGVDDLRTLRAGHLGQCCGGLIRPLRPVVAVVRRAELAAYRLERVEVIAVPAEGGLYDHVHQVQRHRARDFQPPPHWRLRAVQACLHPVHGGRGAFWQPGQLLDVDAFAADVYLLPQPVQHLLLQDPSRSRLYLHQRPDKLVRRCHRLLRHAGDCRELRRCRAGGTPIAAANVEEC